MRENQQKHLIFLLNLLIIYGSSYMFRQYIAILRERSNCLLRDAQLRISRWNIVEGRVLSSGVVRGDLVGCATLGSATY
jgi:hypothetical protein